MVTPLTTVLNSGVFDQAVLDSGRAVPETDALFTLTGRPELVRIRLRDRTAEPTLFPGEAHHLVFSVTAEVVDENLNPTGVSVPERRHTVNGHALPDLDLNQLVIEEANAALTRLKSFLAVAETQALLPFYGGA